MLCTGSGRLDSGSGVRRWVEEVQGVWRALYGEVRGHDLTWRSKYEETLQTLSDRYPGPLDSSAMDRYLGMVSVTTLTLEP